MNKNFNMNNRDVAGVGKTASVCTAGSSRATQDGEYKCLNQRAMFTQITHTDDQVLGLKQMSRISYIPGL